MTRRFTGPIGKSVQPWQAGAPLIARGRVLVQQCLDRMQFGGLKQFVAQEQLPDGSTIRAIAINQGTGAPLIRVFVERPVGDARRIIRVDQILEHGLMWSTGFIHAGDEWAVYASSNGTSLGEPEAWEGHIWLKIFEDPEEQVPCFPDWTGPPEIVGGGYNSELLLQPFSRELLQLYTGLSSGWRRNARNHTGLMRALAQAWGWNKDAGLLGPPGYVGIVRWIETSVTDSILHYARIRIGGGVFAQPMTWPASMDCYARELANNNSTMSERDLRITESAVLHFLDVDLDQPEVELISANTYNTVVVGSPLAYGWAWSPQRWKTGSQDVMRALMVTVRGSAQKTTQVFDLTISANADVLSAALAPRTEEQWTMAHGYTPLWIPAATPNAPVEFCPQHDSTTQATKAKVFGWIGADNADIFVEQGVVSSQYVPQTHEIIDSTNCPTYQGGSDVYVSSHTAYQVGGWSVGGDFTSLDGFSARDEISESEEEEGFVQGDWRSASFLDDPCPGLGGAAAYNSALAAAINELVAALDPDYVGGTYFEHRETYNQRLRKQIQLRDRTKSTSIACFLTGPDSALVVANSVELAAESSRSRETYVYYNGQPELLFVPKTKQGRARIFYGKDDFNGFSEWNETAIFDVEPNSVTEWEYPEWSPAVISEGEVTAILYYGEKQLTIVDSTDPEIASDWSKEVNIAFPYDCEQKPLRIVTPTYSGEVVYSSEANVVAFKASGGYDAKGVNIQVLGAA